MAEGGFDFENPTFDEDRDHTDEINEEPETSFTDETDFQRILTNQYDALNNLTGETQNEQRLKLLKMMVKRFYERNQEPVRFEADEVDWVVGNDQLGRPKFGIEINGNDIPLSYYKSDKADAILQFHSLDTIQRKYGVKFVKDILGVTDFKSSSARVRAGRKDFQAMLAAKDQVDAAIEEIPMRELSTQTDVQSIVDATNTIETSLQALMELPDVKNARTQTEGLTLRELTGLDKALQSIRGELTNNLAKLTDIDKDIAKENRKLQEAEDETTKRDIRSRIKNLEDERDARLEAASANKEELRGQINRIKETINKVLKEDTTLRERLKTLFKEQGITIVSILTAIGMIIGVIVEAVIPTTGGTGTTPPKPPSKEGVKDWVKKQLQNLARLLANLAGKAAAALPGVIGSIVSWLLSATGKVVNWFGNNLWALVVLVAGLLYAAAKEWINKSHK